MGNQAATLNDGHVWCGDLINRRKNGETYWEDSQIAPVKNAHGVVTHYVAVKTDVTERVRNTEKMNAMLRQQEAILQNQLIGIMTVRGKTIIWTNPAIEMMLGYSAHDLPGTPTCNLFASPEAYETFAASISPVLSSGHFFRSQTEYVRKDGIRMWVDVSGSTLDPVTGDSLWGLIDITDNKRLEEEIRAQALHDPMTQLANRRMLNDRLAQAVALSTRSRRYGAVVALDLDNFKPLNDQHGHLVGDLLLIEVARRLSSCVRQVDTVARVGGDEFVVVLAELNMERAQAEAEATAIAEKIRMELAAPYWLTVKNGESAAHVVEHHCSASMGLALFFNSETPQEEILNRADNAMYQAKKAGRNAIRFDRQMDAGLERVSALDIAR